ncbi:MAG: YciK family oxidoreductase [Proteobacteria bacterium]|nr:YciK family oxidoreductase [Pseudomonadota bacterium]
MENVTLTNVTVSPNCLAEKVILITGASDGIGRALALAAAKHGANLIILGKSLKKLESLYDDIVAANAPEPAIHPLNLQLIEQTQADELAQCIYNMFGRLDAIVHNAGISGQITPLEHLEPKKWQEVIHLNLTVPYLLTHSLLPLLRNSQQASILFTSADEARQAKAYWSAYSASKFGIMGLAQSLHEELHDNTDIRVNCINPKAVRTNLRIKAYPGIDPLTYATPEEIVPYYLYLLSQQATHLRGKCILFPV